MSLKTFVKISKVSSLSDARYCAGMMVDILGFNLEDGTEGYVSPEVFKEITEWVAGVKFAGEFTNADTATIKVASADYQLDLIETSNIDQLEELSSLPQGLIFKLVVQSVKDIEGLTAKVSFAGTLCEYITIDCLDPSLFEDLHLQLSSIDENVKIIRSYGLSEASAPSIAADKIYYGIELEGSPEDKPGFKDYGEVMDILEVLEDD